MTPTCMQKCKLIKYTRRQPMPATCVQSLPYPRPRGPFCQWLLNKTVPSQEPPGRYKPLASCTHPCVSLPRRNKGSQQRPNPAGISHTRHQRALRAGRTPTRVPACSTHRNKLYLSLLNFCKITHVLLAEDQLHRHRRPKVLLPDGEQQF